MNKYTDRATELISDIIYNSTFPIKELEKEKKVIIDEIHAYEDMPYEQIFEDFEGILFNNHPLGNSILGKEQHIKSYLQKDVLKFIKGAYNEKNMVWVMAGPAREEDVLKQANKFFTKIKFNGNLNRLKPIANRPKAIVLKKPNSQYHFVAGKRAYPFTHANRFTLILLNNILGGPGMNSRLSMNIREKYGYTYTIESGYHALSDTGIFHIYFATEQQYFDKVRKLVFKELDKMKNEKMNERRLNQYKQQLIGQITMSQENKLNVMLALAKYSLYFNKILSLAEIIEKINNISIIQYENVAQEILNANNMSTLIYEPEA